MKHLLFIFISFILFPFGVVAQSLKANEKIASGIYTFAINMVWPDEETFKDFQIGVLDQDTAFYNLLIRKYDGIKIKRKPTVILHFSKIEDIKPTQVLYVVKKFNKNIDKVAKAIDGNSTLIITNVNSEDKYTMIDYNSALNSLLKEKEFEVNEGNIEKVGIKLSPQFYDFAEGRISWQQLYFKSESSLEKEVQKTTRQQTQIDRQKNEILYQKNEILNQQNEILYQQNQIDEQQNEINNQKTEIEKQKLILEEKRKVLEQQDVKINEQKKVLIKQLEQIGMQRVILILCGFVILLILGILFIIFRSYKEKTKTNEIITQKNTLLTQANAEISEQHNIVSKQKEQIENILFELTNSIRYALQIQNAVLPNEHNIREKIVSDFFVLFKPKDIVSGDFFFVDKTHNCTLIAVADCTGHGVPGAFMSMLCMRLLTEILQEQEVMQANLILDKLRKKLIKTLQQKGMEGEQRDGMDISLLIMDTQTLQCQWAGANNPLYLVSSKDNKLKKIKSDKQPIGIHPNMAEFTNHEFQLHKNDILYLFTDGYADQFGGPMDKKFMSKQVKELLIDICRKPMEEQKLILEKKLDEWRTGHGEVYEQTDDITVFGVKVA